MFLNFCADAWNASVRYHSKILKMTVGLFKNSYHFKKRLDLLSPVAQNVSRRWSTRLEYSPKSVISESSCTKFCSDAPDATISEWFSSSMSLVLLLDFASKDTASICFTFVNSIFKKSAFQYLVNRL